MLVIILGVILKLRRWIFFIQLYNLIKSWCFQFPRNINLWKHLDLMKFHEAWRNSIPPFDQNLSQLTWKNTGKLKFASLSSWRLQCTNVSSRSRTSVSVPGVLRVRMGRAGTFVLISDSGGRCLMNMYGSNSKATSCWSSLSVSVHSYEVENILKHHPTDLGHGLTSS